MSRALISDEDLQEIYNLLKYKFVDSDLLVLALTHSSRVSNSQSRIQSNERLEFLGDRVLGLVLAELLLFAFPDEDEGGIARRHAVLVSGGTLGEISKSIGLGEYILMASGEERMGGRLNPSILADTCEAIIAAIYLDGGLGPVISFIENWWKPFIKNFNSPPKDPKTALQEWAQKKGLPLPNYKEYSRTGPAHNPVFTIEVEVANHGKTKEIGPTKQVAEQRAAEKLLKRLL